VNLDDTIVAVATPPGRGGIGVIRFSGPEAYRIAASLLRLKAHLQPGRAVVCDLIDLEAGSAQSANTLASTTTANLTERLDEVVATYFQKPHSYTSDDVLEISAHGSPVVLRRIIELAQESGARLAEPGEFTMRAFLNGRIDLTQAEAVRDLIDSQTLFQAKVAAQQLEGALSKRLQPTKQKLVELIALLEAGIDFAEDDVSVLPAEQVRERLSAVRTPLEELSRSFAYGKIVHEGLTLAIVGRPNVGKSSLFNRLVERERAIVTATPGTTRDLVSETVALEGIPVKLVDTAGIRRALDEAESIGIRKSMEVLADADMVLVVLDSSEPLMQEDHELLAQAAQRLAIAVENKSDLITPEMACKRNEELRKLNFSHLRTSASTGFGIAELRSEILRRITGNGAGQMESGFITSARHRALVLESRSALSTAESAVKDCVPHEMLLLDLYNALRALDEITGATTNDDILNLIFSTFCIGK
jgi:tRNA modification GTPase